MTATPQPDRRPAAAPCAVLAVGFRLFYLLAGGYAALSVSLWALQSGGWLPGAAAVAGPWWHAHEMLYGYTIAVIAGFLFTAVRNWTQQPTPTGTALAALGVLWLAGRLLSFTAWREWSALTDTLFVLGMAYGIGRPLVRSGNRRNYLFIALVLALGIANLAFHASINGWTAFSPTWALVIGADVVLFIMVIVAGRVVPMFTNNAVAGAGARRHPLVEVFAFGSVIALVVVDMTGPVASAAVIAGVAALAHGVRLALWSPWKTLHTPLLWILHVSYAWIVVHLAMRALTPLVAMPGSLALHALTVGAVGGLTLGMMTRSALGHTGRELVAGRAEMAAFVLVQLAALVRVGVPLTRPELYAFSITASGLLWGAAFAVFTLAYWPMLSRPRIDGRPG